LEEVSLHSIPFLWNYLAEQWTGKRSWQLPSIFEKGLWSFCYFKYPKTRKGS
jgi:hypothetical protein